jgi:hypothetical protein
MPLPKIEKPEQVVLMDGVSATRLVKVVKVHKVDPTVPGRLVAIVEAKKAEGSKE